MRRKRPLERKDQVMRDASLVVIASEDRYAVRQYFDFFRSTRIQFRVLETVDGQSSPTRVLARLDEFMKEYQFGNGDTFWLVCDTDHWIEPNHVQNLRQVVRECRQKGIEVAISNPCFELWLLLHFADFPTEESLSCAEIGDRLRGVVGNYDKRNVCDLPLTNQRVQEAIRRCAMRQSKSDIIPTEMHTWVYRIIENLIARRIVHIPQ